MPGAVPPVAPVGTPQQEIDVLRSQIQQTEGMLESLRQRLDQLQAGAPKQTAE
jgi:hypothetical protein